MLPGFRLAWTRERLLPRMVSEVSCPLGSSSTIVWKRWRSMLSENQMRPRLIGPETPRRGDRRAHAQAFVKVESGNEIGGGVAKLVVAHFGFDGDGPSRTFAGLWGQIAGGVLDGANSVHAQTSFERASDGIADVEAVECVEHLVFGAAGEMKASVSVLDDTWHEAEGIAEVAILRERHVEDVHATKSVRGVVAFEFYDGVLGGGHFDGFEDFALVVEDYDELAAGRDFDRIILQCKEAVAPCRDSVFARREHVEIEGAGGIGAGVG